MAGEQELTEEDVSAMVLETEQEIFDEAVGDEPAENTGDRSLEDMDEDELEASTDEEGEQEAPEEQAEGEEDEAPVEEPTARREEARVPSGRLREESERRREAETALANERERIAALEARFNDFMARSQQPQPQPATPAQRPDMFADPEGWEKAVRAEVRGELEKSVNERLLNASFANAHEEHKDEFEYAYKALTSLDPNDPRNRTAVQSITNAPNPGRELMKWAEPRLETYREQKRERESQQFEQLLDNPEFLQAALDRARGRARGNANGRQPQTETRTPRMPPSLNSATGGNQRIADPEMYNDSDRSVFDYATR